VEELRARGFSVQSIHTVGDGCPDLLVGCPINRKNYLFEIKDPAKRPSQRALTKDEEEWHARWRGQVAIAHSVDEILEAIR